MDRSLKRSGRIHELELKHQNALHQTAIVSKDENARRLKLKSHLLQDSKGSLQDQLSEKDEHISKMLAKYQQIANELQAVKETVRKRDAQIKSQTRDFTHLQAELQSLESASQDSAKLLTEKLALSRELNVIKPEFEHVKSQLSHQQSVIAEKHALERQLNTLEVELEAEKRSKQRAQKDDRDETDELQARIQELEKRLAAEKKDKERVRKEGELALAEAASQQEDNDGSDKLQARVQELEKKLAAEKKDKVRVQKEGERALAEATAQHEVFEERLGTMKAKLRETRDELKKCQAELSKARTVSTISDAKEKAGARKQMKRSIEATTADVTIDTPHADEEKVKKALKKRGEQTVANMGEKSAFSITPFLNRSKGLEESLEDADLEADQSYVPQSKRAEPSPVQDEPQPEVSEEEAAPEPAPKPKARGRPRKVLGEISTAKNANAAKRSQTKAGEKTKASKPDASQDKPDEEPSQGAENQPASPPAKESEKEAEREEEAPAEKPKPAKRAPIRKLKTAKQADDSVVEPEPKKKKRKLLGGPKSTLFDDEEGEPPVAAAKKPAPGGKVSMAPARKLGAVGAVKRDAFAGKGFSPLKRDRRGVHASFLA